MIIDMFAYDNHFIIRGSCYDRVAEHTHGKLATAQTQTPATSGPSAPTARALAAMTHTRHGVA